MVLNTDWAQVEVIDLINDGSGLAFGIIGGRSTGVVVKTIVPGGVADRDGRLQSGDHILQIGEVNLRGLGSEQVASVLRQCGVHVRMIVARPIEATTIDIESLVRHVPVVPTSILGDPVELDRHLVENGFGDIFSASPPSDAYNATPYIYTSQQTDIQLHSIPRLNDYRSTQTNGRTASPIVAKKTSQAPTVITQEVETLEEVTTPETEMYTVKLRKDDLGLGITVAGYVCEREEISGIFVKSISEGSAAATNGKIKINDRIVEVDGVSVLGRTNHHAVETLRNTGPIVTITLERYLRGPKYEQLQLAIKASELRAPSPPSPSVTSLPKVLPPSLSSAVVEEDGESRTSFDFDSGVLAEHPELDGEEVKRRSVQFSVCSRESIRERWEGKAGEDAEVVIAVMTKDDNSGLGISLEGTVDVEGGLEVRPHHYIRNILPNGPVGKHGSLQSGDELLEVNGIQLLGMNHVQVVSILKHLPNRVVLVCARRAVPTRIIDTGQCRDAFQARNILAGSLHTLIPNSEGKMVKAKSDTSIASSEACSGSVDARSKSLEVLSVGTAGLPMWCAEHVTVQLTKGDFGLGFSILDYQDPLDKEKTAIVIRSLVPGGVAQVNGGLIPGDRLIAVNEVVVDHGTLDRAVQVLKSTPKGVVRLTVAKPLSANDNVSYHSQCIRKVIEEWTRDLQRIRWN